MLDRFKREFDLNVTFGHEGGYQTDRKMRTETLLPLDQYTPEGEQYRTDIDPGAMRRNALTHCPGLSSDAGQVQLIDGLMSLVTPDWEDKFSPLKDKGIETETIPDHVVPDLMLWVHKSMATEIAGKMAENHTWKVRPSLKNLLANLVLKMLVCPDRSVSMKHLRQFKEFMNFSYGQYFAQEKMDTVVADGYTYHELRDFWATLIDSGAFSVTYDSAVFM